MTLYILRSPAYVANTSNVTTQYINHRRYTMRDIGAIEKRVENIEYYTALSKPRLTNAWPSSAKSWMARCHIN